MTAWEKLGRLWAPGEGDRHPKLLTHAANPLPVRIEGDVYRIFYSGRDARNRSSVGAVDIDIVRRTLLREHREPFLEHGGDGSFHADGVSIANCYEACGTRYMLFMGWQAPQGAHWRGDIGRIIVSPQLTLSFESEQPFLGSDAGDPVSLSYPWVEPWSDGGYRMWYGSTVQWDAGNGEMLHVIKAATSPDGHRWKRIGAAVPAQLGVAQAFSRPTVAQRPDGSAQMWFSYRGGAGSKYRIGYARSPDGVQWRLALEESGITVSADGWDSEMVEYPFVWVHEGVQYMLYNGNGYGRTGFGLAARSPT